METWPGVRTILVPPDIVGVKRRSPVPVKKKTPWHPQPDGAAPTERAGGREWFSDRLFVEAQDNHARVGYSTSITVHICLAIAVIGVVLTRIDQPLLVRVGSSLVMPAIMSIVPVADLPSPPARTVERPAPKTEPKPAEAPSVSDSNEPPPAASGESPAPPVDAPTGIKPETGAEGNTGNVDGAEGGVPGGIAGGVPGGTGSAASPSHGPVRAGGAIQPPRKIKDVKPVYPQGLLSDRIRGTVIIDATIGTSGKVEDTRVLHSVPPLDHAALNAVRQWEYTPSLLNGIPVAVILTVIVNFAIQ